MRRLGLTGGIAGGKSTVAAMLRERGFHVLDADALAHQLIEPGQPAYDEIVKAFGSFIVAHDSGRIDRAKLAAIVFADPQKLRLLNSIVHPRVEQATNRQFDEWERAGVPDAAFVEAALLVEAGMAARLDGLVVAWCRPDQQIERLLARGFSAEDGAHRIQAQMPVEEKLRHATWRIDCSGSLAHTLEQVEALISQLRSAAPRNP